MDDLQESLELEGLQPAWVQRALRHNSGEQGNTPTDELTTEESNPSVAQEVALTPEQLEDIYLSGDVETLNGRPVIEGPHL